MKRYTGYIGMSPAAAGEVEVKRYLYHLISDQKLSRSYVNQTYSALKIFYEKVVKKSGVVGQIPRVKKAQKLPVVLSPDEVARLLGVLSNLKHRAILTVIYSAGLRLSEACQFYRERYGAQMPLRHHRAMRAIEICRTAILGGHVAYCDTYGAVRVAYNSCRNRRWTTWGGIPIGWPSAMIASSALRATRSRSLTVTRRMGINAS